MVPAGKPPALRRRRFVRSAWAKRFSRSALARSASVGGFSITGESSRACDRWVKPVLPLPPRAGVRYSPALFSCRLSSVVERILGKAEVDSSILSGGTTEGLSENLTAYQPHRPV